MYQHIVFDEMPEINDCTDDKDDIKAIYQHETDYIDYGIYENITNTIQFFNEIEKSQGENFLENHLMHVTDIGCPSNPLDKHSQESACKEIYDMEQNEILQLNAEISAKRHKDIENEKNKKNQVENKDMSGDPIILPVYKSTVHGQHKVMFANTVTSHKNGLYKNIHTEDIEAVEHCHVHDGETFSYDYDDDLTSSAPMVEAVCLDIKQATQVQFADNTYGKIKYSKRGTVTATYETSFQKKNMEIPVVIDNGASINITPKWYYDKHRALHHLPKTTSNLPSILTGNGPIRTYFWIDIPIRIQGVYMQLKTLVCGSLEPYAILLSRMLLDQIQAIQLYDKCEILVRQVTLPL